MSKKKKRNYLERVAEAPQPPTHIIDPNVARQLQIIFGFKNLDLDKKPFDCSAGHGERLLYIFKTLRLFSSVIRVRLGLDYPKCHPVSEDQIKRYNLHYLVSLAPNKRMHQLGRSRTPQRIIGYFDTPVNLFQVCFLDLNHKLSGD